jgi:hypothetical protein
MSTSRLVQHAHLVWRSERIIAELRLKRLLGNLGLQAFAMLMACFAMLLFELAAYFALVQSFGAIASAAILGGCNLVVAGVLVVLAARRPASRELVMAGEVHDDALAALTSEIHQAETAAPVALRAAIESAAIPILLPLIPLLIQRLRRHGHKSDNAATEAN